MDKALFQLRLFVHQRLYTAAEEILGHFEKTIMLAVSEVEGIQSLKGGECLQDQLSQTNTGCPLTSSSTEQTDEADTLVLQENQDSSSTEQSDFSLDPEVPGPSQPCADLDNDGWNFAETDFVIPEMKEEQKDLVDENETSTMVVAALRDCGEELVNNAGGDVSRKDEAELPNGPHSVKGQQERHFCHLCGKSFLYIGALMRHTAKHESKTDCGLCGLKHPSTKRLISHLKSFHSTSNFCEVCGRTYAKKHSLRVHKKVHTGNKDFVCQECGKSFYCKAHLVVHVRTHTGDKPYKCDICGKAFSQSQSLLTHKRGHLGEKPYHCEFCGKRFVTSSALNNHLRFHTGEKPYSCNICGKKFRASGQMTRHRATHTGDEPQACVVSGI